MSISQRPNLAGKAAGMLPESRWKPLLVACAALQDSAIHEPNNLFDDLWVEIGPGYEFKGMKGYAFGHWDLPQTAMEALRYAPEYARVQMENYFSLIYPDGMMPGTFSSTDHGSQDLIRPKTPLSYSHPPLWQEFVTDYFKLTKDREFLQKAFAFGKKNLPWWQRERRAPEGGYYYLDVVKRWWESGVDAGVRWDDIDGKPHACIDASCHLYSLLRRMGQWAKILGENAKEFTTEAETLRNFINTELWDNETKFYYDIQAVRGKKKKIMTYEGFWPVALEIAPLDRLGYLMEHLFNPQKFGTYHPIPSIAADEDEHSKNCWRGPAWNSQAFWIIRGCVHLGLKEQACKLAEKVLDASAARYDDHGMIFEYYNSTGRSMEGMQRKAESDRGPCHDYLGHNPLNAIYWLYSLATTKSESSYVTENQQLSTPTV